MRSSMRRFGCCNALKNGRKKRKWFCSEKCVRDGFEGLESWSVRGLGEGGRLVLPGIRWCSDT